MGKTLETEVFLDTHVVVWLYEGAAERFSKRAKKVIEDSTLWVSPMSLLEIDCLHECKKISCSSHVIQKDLNDRIDLNIANDSFTEIVQEATGLRWTREPFDRLIVAHASLRQASLLTKDSLIKKLFSRCIW